MILVVSDDDDNDDDDDDCYDWWFRDVKIGLSYCSGFWLMRGSLLGGSFDRLFVRLFASFIMRIIMYRTVGGKSCYYYRTSTVESRLN